MHDFLRRARGWLTGLNAVSARFDLLQNRTDALMGASEQTNAALAELAAALESIRPGPELAEIRGRLDGLAASSLAARSELARELDAEADRRRLAELALASRLNDQGSSMRGMEADLAALRAQVSQVQVGLDEMAVRFDAHAQHSVHWGAEMRDGLQVQLDAIARRVADLPGALEWKAIASRLDGVEAALAAGRWADSAHAQLSGAAPLRLLGEAGARPLAFLLQSLELVNHYAAVWDLLPQGGFDVLLHGVDEAAARQALGAWRCQVFATDEVLADGRKYACLVSNHPVEGGEPPLIKRLAERNVRFMYAAGKSGWNLSEWNRLYDLILCFGPHHAAAFSALTDGLVIQMGYPRFDRYFNDQVDRDALCGRFGCDPAKETVVWLPTWKELSSVGHFDDEISALSDRYNVVVKLHPLMSEAEPDRVESLRKHHFSCLLTDSTDNLPLYQLADYMLFDFGGPPLAAIYCDKKMLLLDVPGALADPLLGPDSPDVAIRAQLGSLEPGGGAIARSLASPAHWEAQVPARKALRRTYFAPHFGFSAAVAANALLRLDTLRAGAG